MKILYAFDNPETDSSPYVRTIMQETQNHAPDWQIDAGIKTFWSDQSFSYDIIHIMFPHFLLLQHNPPAERHSCSELKRHLQQLKDKGVIIVSTCHNLQPHYNNDRDAINSYDLVYGASDMVFHLGQYSLEIARQKFPNVHHVLLEHPVYEREYPIIPQKTESLEKLGLDASFQYILCFGTFRNDEERNLVINASQIVKKQRIRILAPSFYRVRPRRNKLIVLAQWCKKNYYALRYPNIINQGKLVPPSMVPYIIKACDIALIQRIHILNSGNLPLNYYFGNVVVGPLEGNVGTILKTTGNPTFNPKDSRSVIKAIQDGLLLAKQGLGEKNKDYAIQHWSTRIIGKQQFEYYLTILKDKEQMKK